MNKYIYFNFILFFSLFFHQTSFAQSEHFDKPLKIIQKRLIRGTEQPIKIDSKKAYTCLVYSKYVVILGTNALYGGPEKGIPNFQVKQRQQPTRTTIPECTLKQGKIVFDLKEGGFYFLGIYKDLILVDEGTWIYRPLTVYNLDNGKKLFTGSYVRNTNDDWERMFISNGILKFPRAIVSEKQDTFCDPIPSNKDCKTFLKNCWEKIKVKPKAISKTQLNYQCTMAMCKNSDGLNVEVSLDLNTFKEHYTGRIFCGLHE